MCDYINQSWLVNAKKRVQKSVKKYSENKMDFEKISNKSGFNLLNF